MHLVRSLVVYLWAAMIMIGGLPFLLFKERQMQKHFVKGVRGLYRMVHWFAGTVLFFAGVRMTVSGQEHIPSEGSLMIIGNHQSFFDIPILVSCIERPVGFLAKEELKKVPVLSSWTRGIGSVFIARGESRKALEAILVAAKRLKNNEFAFVVFPEGSRSKDGQMAPFKPGSMKIATKSKCAILPVAIDGSSEVMAKNSMLIKGGSVHVTFFPPLSPEQVQEMETVDLAKHCEDLIQSAVHSREVNR